VAADLAEAAERGDPQAALGERRGRAQFRMRMTQKTLLTTRATYRWARGAHDVRAEAVVVVGCGHRCPAYSVVKYVCASGRAKSGYWSCTPPAARSILSCSISSGVHSAMGARRGPAGRPLRASAALVVITPWVRNIPV